jgi:hypothetical protein
LTDFDLPYGVRDLSWRVLCHHKLPRSGFRKDQGQAISANSARFLVNGAYADSVYDTPWGNVGRNTLRNAATNWANFQISKDTKVTERVKARFDAAFLNVFTHPNYSSIGPILDDAGYTQEGTGFGIPSLWSGGNRTIKFGLKISF